MFVSLFDAFKIFPSSCFWSSFSIAVLTSVGFSRWITAYPFTYPFGIRGISISSTWTLSSSNFTRSSFRIFSGKLKTTTRHAIRECNVSWLSFWWDDLYFPLLNSENSRSLTPLFFLIASSASSGVSYVKMAFPVRSPSGFLIKLTDFKFSP